MLPMFQINPVARRADANSYMASVQSLSALTDNNHSVTSFPPSALAPTQLQYPPPTSAAWYYDQSTSGGQYAAQYGYCQPAAQWQQHVGDAQQCSWYVNGYAGATTDGYNWYQQRAQQEYLWRRSPTRSR